MRSVHGHGTTPGTNEVRTPFTNTAHHQFLEGTILVGRNRSFLALYCWHNHTELDCVLWWFFEVGFSFSDAMDRSSLDWNVIVINVFVSFRIIQTNSVYLYGRQKTQDCRLWALCLCLKDRRWTRFIICFFLSRGINGKGNNVVLQVEEWSAFCVHH